MIPRLRAGMTLRLPSGNAVVLRAQARGEWTCEFTPQSARRGEVVFSGAWLRKHCTVC